MINFNEDGGVKRYTSAHITHNGITGEKMAVKHGRILNNIPSQRQSRPPKLNKNTNPILKSKIRQSVLNSKLQIRRGLYEDLKKKVELLDFSRKSYESYYNHYSTDMKGTPVATRVKIKGFKFLDNLGGLVAKVDVESFNELNIITTFEVNPRYQGFGFARDLLRLAESSLNANAVECRIKDDNKIRFFESNGFKKVAFKKQTCILKLDNRTHAVDRAQSVELFDKPSSLSAEYDNELYHTGGYDYEGYRNYL